MNESSSKDPSEETPDLINSEKNEESIQKSASEETLKKIEDQIENIKPELLDGLPDKKKS